MRTKNKKRRRVVAKVNVDELVTSFKTIDAVETLELFDLEPEPTTISESHARSIVGEIERVGYYDYYASDPALKPSIRRVISFGVNRPSIIGDRHLHCSESGLDGRIRFTITRKK